MLLKDHDVCLLSWYISLSLFQIATLLLSVEIELWKPDPLLQEKEGLVNYVYEGHSPLEFNWLDDNVSTVAEKISGICH